MTTRSELLESLREIQARQTNHSDIEADHSDADDALLDHIGDDEIRAAYEDIKRWYA